jgi:hypothetical protein
MVINAISRSTHLTDFPVDMAGIAPDIFLAPPADSADANEVNQVKDLVERSMK